jgi:hypothetical protein
MVGHLNPPPLALVATIARLFMRPSSHHFLIRWLSNNAMGNVGLMSAGKRSIGESAETVGRKRNRVEHESH